MQTTSHDHQDCATTFKESILILHFEFLGTLLLTSLFNSCYQTGYQTGDVAGLLSGFFILLIFSARISGSHFNPAVTLAFMFRKDTGRFSRVLGILYIAAQYAGGFVGAIISYNLFQANKIQPLSVRDNHDGTTLLIQAIFVEIIGAMLVTFLYLTQTEEKTKMSNDPAITTLIIASTYVAIVLYGEASGVVSGTPYNPAASFGLSFAIIFQGNLKKTTHTWVFLIFSYVGSILAVILFEFIYKRAMAAIEEREGDDDDDDGVQQRNDSLLQDNPYDK